MRVLNKFLEVFRLTSDFFELPSNLCYGSLSSSVRFYPCSAQCSLVKVYGRVTSLRFD